MVVDDKITRKKKKEPTLKTIRKRTIFVLKRSDGNLLQDNKKKKNQPPRED